jgi:nitroimidazol reductase NimA-like FMN-containing flavoprotein (pyridoxamine 5'-phosphate oxidase superfamily)
LDDIEARAFLARQHVGRLAFLAPRPRRHRAISYTFDGGWILGRTSVGTKLSTLAHHPWCAFETDHVVGPFEWTSVVAKGTFYLLDPEAGSPDLYSKALASARSLVPDASRRPIPRPSRRALRDLRERDHGSEREVGLAQFIASGTLCATSSGIAPPISVGFAPPCSARTMG